MDFNNVVTLLVFIVVIGIVIGFVTDPANGIFKKMDDAKQNLENDTDVGGYVGSFSLLGKLTIVIAIFVGTGLVVYKKLMSFAG